MSSILEALRELEGERPPAARREIPPSEPPPNVAHRATGALIPLAGGLAIGILAFGIYALGPRLVTPRPPSDVVASVRQTEPATAERPAWLDTADAPRARVNRGAVSAPAPDYPEASERPAASTRASDAAPIDEPAPAETRPEPRPSSSGGQVAVESIAYSNNAMERTTTMRFHGRRVTLRQRDTVDGIEVQLIMPNGVYVQRGSEVYLLPLLR